MISDDEKLEFTASHFQEVKLIELWLSSEEFTGVVPPHVAKIANAVAKPFNAELTALRARLKDVIHDSEVVKKDNRELRQERDALRAALKTAREALDRAHLLTCDETKIDERCFICQALAKLDEAGAG